MTFEIAFTQLPCGGDCGTVWNEPGLIEPREIQVRAVAGGWGLKCDGERELLACSQCSTHAAKSELPTE